MNAVCRIVFSFLKGILSQGGTGHIFLSGGVVVIIFCCSLWLYSFIILCKRKEYSVEKYSLIWM